MPSGGPSFQRCNALEQSNSGLPNISFTCSSMSENRFCTGNICVQNHGMVDHSCRAQSNNQLSSPTILLTNAVKRNPVFFKPSRRHVCAFFFTSSSLTQISIHAFCPPCLASQHSSALIAPKTMLKMSASHAVVGVLPLSNRPDSPHYESCTATN